MSPLTRTMGGGFVGTLSELGSETGIESTGSDLESNRKRNHVGSGGRDHRGETSNDEAVADSIRRGFPRLWNDSERPPRMIGVTTDEP